MLPQDKANHLVYGSIVFLAGAFVGGQVGQNPADCGLAAAAAAGALKELADWLLNRKALAAGLPPQHGVEFWDFAATTAGGLIGFAAMVLA
jgi:hypothetical protein